MQTNIHKFMDFDSSMTLTFIQDAPGVKVTTSGFNSRADSQSKTL